MITGIVRKNLLKVSILLHFLFFKIYYCYHGTMVGIYQCCYSVIFECFLVPIGVGFYITNNTPPDWHPRGIVCATVRIPPVQNF